MEKARETIEEIEEIKRTEMMIRDNSLLYRQALINDSGASSFVLLLLLLLSLLLSISKK